MAKLRIIGVEATNWCQHEYLNVRLCPTTNVITGANGKGKSNAVAAIATGIGGSPVVGSLPKNIRHGADSSTICVEFLAGGVECRITRTFSAKQIFGEDGKLLGRGKLSTSASLQVGDEPEIQKPAAVADRLSELFGIPVEALFTHVFIPQGKLNDLLFSPAARLDGIGKLIPAVNRAPGILTSTTEELAKAPVPQVMESMASAEERMLSAVNELAAADQAVTTERAGAGWWAGPAFLTHHDAVKSVSGLLRDAEQLGRSMSEIRSDLDAANKRLSEIPSVDPIPDEYKESIDKYRAASVVYVERDRSRDALRNAKESAEAAREALGRAVAAVFGPEESARMDKAVEAKAAALHELKVIKSLESDLARAGEDVPMPDEKDILDLEGMLPELNARITALSGVEGEKRAKAEQASADIAEAKKRGRVCPTCGSEFANYHEYMRQKEEAVVALSREMKEAADSLAAMRAMHTKTTNTVTTLRNARRDAEEKNRRRSEIRAALGRTDKQEVEARCASSSAEVERLAKMRDDARMFEEVSKRAAEAERLLACIGTAEDLEARIEEAKAVVTAYVDRQDARAKYATASAARKESEARIGQLSARLDAANAKLAEISAAVAEKKCALNPDMTTSVSEVDDAMTKRAEHQQRLAVLVERAAGAARRRDDAEAILKKVSEQHAAAAEAEEYRRQIDLIRSAFHRDAFPSAVMSRHMRRLEEATNGYLRTFGKEFRLVIGEDTSWNYLYPSGYECDAERLSGGEKCAVGVSFRYAAAKVFAANLGFLVLDEPTEFLDKASRERMIEVIRQAATDGAQSGMQIVMITHAEELFDVFDNRIEIA